MQAVEFFLFGHQGCETSLWVVVKPGCYDVFDDPLREKPMRDVSVFQVVPDGGAGDVGEFREVGAAEEIDRALPSDDRDDSELLDIFNLVPLGKALGFICPNEQVQVVSGMQLLQESQETDRVPDVVVPFNGGDHYLMIPVDAEGFQAHLVAMLEGGHLLSEGVTPAGDYEEVVQIDGAGECPACQPDVP